MQTVNVAEFKKRLSSFIDLVEGGETVEVCRRNVPVARLVKIESPRQNHTVLGCGEGTVEYRGSVTEPLIPEDSWEMLARGEAEE